MQRSLHELDNITAEGTEAFDNLRAIVNTLVENGAGEHWAEIMRRDLKEAKRCFTLNALSDPNIRCDRCDSLDSNFRAILKKIDELVISDETRARINFEHKECSRAVQAWKAHLLRSVNQE